MSAIFKFLLCLLVLWCGCSAGQGIDYMPPHPAFSGGRGGGGGGGVSAVDPVTSANCFEFYIREQQRISTVYSGDYNKCLWTARLERERVQNDVAQSRASLTEATAALCARIRACNSLNDTLQMFQCHSKSGGVNIRTAYDASDNSTQIGSVMVERFRMIGVRQEQCTHNVRRTYISDVGKNYNTLQNCLAPPLIMYATRPEWHPNGPTPGPNMVRSSTAAAAPEARPTSTSILDVRPSPSTGTAQSSTTTTTTTTQAPSTTTPQGVVADEFATTEGGIDIVAEVNANLQRKFAQLFQRL